MTGDKSDMGSSVKVAGLLGMGVTLMLLGLSLLPAPYSNGFAGAWPAMPTAAYFAGVILALLGLMALWKGHQFWGSAFVSFGAYFFVWTKLTPLGLGPVIWYGFAGFTFVFMLMSLTFLISSMKHGWLAFLFFLFLFVSYALWLAMAWMHGAGNSVSDGQLWATGGVTILTGLIGWYMATAQLTNWTWGKKFLPG